MLGHGLHGALLSSFINHLRRSASGQCCAAPARASWQARCGPYPDPIQFRDQLHIAQSSVGHNGPRARSKCSIVPRPARPNSMQGRACAAPLAATHSATHVSLAARAHSPSSTRVAARATVLSAPSRARLPSPPCTPPTGTGTGAGAGAGTTSVSLGSRGPTGDRSRSRSR